MSKPALPAHRPNLYDLVALVKPRVINITSPTVIQLAVMDVLNDANGWDISVGNIEQILEQL